jgi:hypothetical protein
MRTPPVLEKYFSDDEDSEEFVTSTEIVKTKEKIEKSGGLTSDDDGVIEEDFHFKRYGKRREHKYTETEMAEIRNSCSRTIVHDYGDYDMYHISNEERSRNDQLAAISMKLGRLKRIYRKVDEYIEAMRIVFEAWSMLEKVNYLHTREEFFQMVADGRIVSNRIIMPKLKGIDKYNMDIIINYISNPGLDASQLLPKKKERDYDSFYDDDCVEEDEAETMIRLLSKEEAEYIINGTAEKMEIGYIKDKYIKGYDKGKFGRKKKGKESKHDRHIREGLSQMLNKIQNGSHYKENGNSYAVTHSLFEPEKKEKSFWDELNFDGSWANEDDVRLFEIAANEEMMKQFSIKEKHLTYGDMELKRFFNVLEDNGVNVIELRKKINMVEEEDIHRKEKYARKEDKKLENSILQRITKLNRTPKFKKIVNKAEEALAKFREGEV